MFISVLQLAGCQMFSMKLQILHTANSSLWIIILILMAFFYTPSKCSPSDFLSLTVVSELSVSAASPRYWRFSYLERGPALRRQLCSCAAVRSLGQGSHLPFSRDLLLSWALTFGVCLSYVTGMLCLVPYCLDFDLLTWLPVLTLDLLHHQGWCGRHRSLGHQSHYPGPTLLSSFRCGGPVSLSAGHCLCCPSDARSWFTFPCKAACPCCFLIRA